MQKYLWILLASLSSSGLYAGARVEASVQLAQNDGRYEYSNQDSDESEWSAPDRAAEISGDEDWGWRRRPYRRYRRHHWWYDHRRPWPRDEATIEGSMSGGGLQGQGNNIPGSRYKSESKRGETYFRGERSSKDTYFNGSSPREETYYEGSKQRGGYNRSMHPNRKWQRSSYQYKEQQRYYSEGRPSRMQRQSSY